MSPLESLAVKQYETAPQTQIHVFDVDPRKILSDYFASSLAQLASHLPATVDRVQANRYDTHGYRAGQEALLRATRTAASLLSSIGVNKDDYLIAAGKQFKELGLEMLAAMYDGHVAGQRDNPLKIPKYTVEDRDRYQTLVELGEQVGDLALHIRNYWVDVDFAFHAVGSSLTNNKIPFNEHTPCLSSASTTLHNIRAQMHELSSQVLENRRKAREQPQEYTGPQSTEQQEYRKAANE